MKIIDLEGLKNRDIYLIDYTRFGHSKSSRVKVRREGHKIRFTLLDPVSSFHAGYSYYIPRSRYYGTLLSSGKIILK